MLLAIDIGNTNIVVGGMKGKEVLLLERISTNRKSTELEYALSIKTVMELYNLEGSDFDGAIISSVVPNVTETIKKAIKILLGMDAIILGPGIKTGLNIKTDSPSETGKDRVADAVAAVNEYGAPVVTIDMGTATTFTVIDENNNLIGGMIMPGLRISLDALTSRASMLGGIGIDKPDDIIGSNTVDAMKSGLIYGHAGAIDGILDRLEEKLGHPITAVGTGGLSPKVIPLCRHRIIHDENLLLKGLGIIYEKNTYKRH